MGTNALIDRRDADAIAIALDELISYVDTVGDEGSLDDEEMPTDKLRWTITRLRSLLDRFANYEHLKAASDRRNRVVMVDPVRFTVRPTPPSAPPPTEGMGSCEQ